MYHIHLSNWCWLLRPDLEGGKHCSAGIRPKRCNNNRLHWFTTVYNENIALALLYRGTQDNSNEKPQRVKTVSGIGFIHRRELKYSDIVFNRLLASKPERRDSPPSKEPFFLTKSSLLSICLVSPCQCLSVSALLCFKDFAIGSVRVEDRKIYTPHGFCFTLRRRVTG